MVGVFKRFAKIGGNAAANHQDTLCELVKSFMALVTATDFLEVRCQVAYRGCPSLLTWDQFEEEDVRQHVRPTLFS